MDDHKLQQLEKLITSLDNQLSAKDFEIAFTEVMKVVADAKDALEGRASEIEASLSKTAAKLADETTKLTKKVRQELVKEVKDTLQKLQKGVLDERKAVQDAIDRASALKAPVIDYSVVAGLIPKVEIEEETPESIRDALETLTGNDRLDQSAIKGLEDDIKELKARPTGSTRFVGGGAGIKSDRKSVV
jgi:transketolase